MKPRWGWMCLLLLSVAMVTWAQEEELDEDDEEEAQVEDGDVDSEADSGEMTADANVSFQVTYKTPVPTGEVFFAETFDDGLLSSWTKSKTMKEDADEDIAKYDGKWEVEALKENKVPGDLGLVLKSRAKHHAISSPLSKPYIFKDRPLVVQYEVNFQDGIDCGGAYIKLLSDSPDLDLEQFHDRTPYSIMFGPDKCGEDYKLHFIFRHKNPLNEDFEEKHAKRADADLRKVYSDKKTHLFTLVLNPDNSYEIFIDQSSASKGNLLTDVIPPVNPPKEIDDPKDTKPEDWDERAKIPDPEAVKPDDWDEEAPAMIPDPDALKPDGWLDEEPEFVPDPTATKPDDWDEEMDGEWEAPQVPNPACQTAPGCGEWKSPTINNPKYKGKWKAPLIDNPNYQGVWSPRKILNPDYFEDLEPFKMTAVRAVGLELWSMTSDIYFDNFIITADKEVADRWAADSWGLKKLVASANEPGVFTQLTLAAEERPWLWVVYILTVGLPIGLGVLFCWPKKSDDDYVYKKIDPSKTGAVEEEEEEEDEVEEEEQKKGNLEDQGNVEEVAEPAEEKENRSGDEDDAAGGEQEEEEDEEEEEEEEEEQASKSNETPSDDEMKDADEGIQGTGDGQKQAVRKRRVRKD
ncbi:calmegin [Astyanax mexicanus]|uniref:calmegin n=1 Tax=Astyanax mexicanus TaxID=7994 RepID=UPI0020CB52AF|nr:calmegin [Astyanax mexicanus]